MNGSEHYREAERLLELAGPDWVHSAQVTAAAQVHATLALAAATALPSYLASNTERTFDHENWRKATTSDGTS